MTRWIFWRSLGVIIGLGVTVRASRGGGSGRPQSNYCLLSNASMARWPRQTWTTVFTYGSVFVLFPLLALLAYAWVHGWIF